MAKSIYTPTHYTAGYKGILNKGSLQAYVKTFTLKIMLRGTDWVQGFWNLDAELEEFGIVVHIRACKYKLSLSHPSVMQIGLNISEHEDYC